MKTSIKIKKFWYADVASDGGLGTNWKEIQIGQREATVQFNGSDADTSNYKNVVGSIIESSTVKGDMTINFQFADWTAETIADFTGGTVSTSASSTRFSSPENPNQAVEKSVKFLSEKNILFELPRVSFDGFPMVNDDDLHYFQVNGVVLKPEKSGISTWAFDVITLVSANDITSFVLAEQSAAATINASAHTVAITVVTGTDRSDLSPVIGVSLGASISPASGEETDFTSAVTYTVTAADGTTQNWTVTVTVAS